MPAFQNSPLRVLGIPSKKKKESKSEKTRIAIEFEILEVLYTASCVFESPFSSKYGFDTPIRARVITTLLGLSVVRESGVLSEEEEVGWGSTRI